MYVYKTQAPKKTTKRIHKLVRKACHAKLVRRGVKEVVKGIRKGEKGFCIIAGDISPIDGESFLRLSCVDFLFLLKFLFFAFCIFPPHSD